MTLKASDKPYLFWASWMSLDTGMVSFTKNWSKKHLPQLSMGSSHTPVERIERAEPLWYGLHSGYYLNKGKIRFVFRLGTNKKLETGVQVYLAGSFNGWSDAVGKDDWKLKPKRLAGERCLSLDVPKDHFPSFDLHHFKFVTGEGEWMDVSPDAPNAETDDHGIRNYTLNFDRTGQHIFRFTTAGSLTEVDSYDLHFQDGHEQESVVMHPGVFLKKLETSQRMGPQVLGEITRFSLFAPRAREVRLYLFDDLEDDNGEIQPIELKCDKEFVWKVDVQGDRHSWFYYYKIDGEELTGSSYFDPDFKILDPYAPAVVSALGPGIVLRDSIYDHHRPKPFKCPSWHDLVICETHLRDLNAFAPIEMTDEERLGYSGFKKWVQSERFYLKELGVNAIELQPLQAFDAKSKEEYAWGYMPINYFSPTPHYSLNPESASMVHELQELVDQLHDEGFAVILDVVYNHVGDPNFLQFIDKEYYFLINEEGYYENHSGCGNTLDANAPMVRYLIRDSLIHWIKNYGIDGFRFDLGELIGKEALIWIEAEVKKVKPDVVLVVEPWSFRGHIAKDLKPTGVASWSDGFRETTKDYLLGKASPEQLDFFFRGSGPYIARFPAQTFNYVESHDDRCWIDKITENSDFNGSFPTALDRRRTHLMVATLMLSTGVPMLNAGMDFLKSKQGVNNTYLRGDLNALPYGRGVVYSGTVEYFRKWIQFRLSKLGSLVRLDGFPAEDYWKTYIQNQAYGVLINANHARGSKQILFVLNPSFFEEKIQLDGVDFAKATFISDTERFQILGLNSPHYHIDGNLLYLPGQSLGVWIVNNL